VIFIIGLANFPIVGLKNKPATRAMQTGKMMRGYREDAYLLSKKSSKCNDKIRIRTELTKNTRI